MLKIEKFTDVCMTGSMLIPPVIQTSEHFYKFSTYIFSADIINNGNRTEWSPIRSVIIRVINKIGRPRSGSPIC